MRIITPMSLVKSIPYLLIIWALLTFATEPSGLGIAIAIFAGLGSGIHLGRAK